MHSCILGTLIFTQTKDTVHWVKIVFILMKDALDWLPCSYPDEGRSLASMVTLHHFTSPHGQQIHTLWEQKI